MHPPSPALSGAGGRRELGLVCATSAPRRQSVGRKEENSTSSFEFLGNPRATAPRTGRVSAISTWSQGESVLTIAGFQEPVPEAG